MSFIRQLSRRVSLMLAVAATVWAAAAPSAHAAIITWGSPTTISAASDVDLTGTLTYAYDLGSSSSVTVNTVSFAAWQPANSFTTSNSEVTSPNATLTNASPASGSFATAGNGGTTGAIGTLNTNYPSYYTLLTTEAFNANGADLLTLTLNNLTSGKSYELEFWVNDSRSAGNTRSDFLSTAGGPTATLSFNGGTINGVGQFVIGTFTANATTQAIAINSPATESSQIGAFQLREVPEPTSFVLLAVAGGLECFRRRRS